MVSGAIACNCMIVFNVRNNSFQTDWISSSSTLSQFRNNNEDAPGMPALFTDIRGVISCFSSLVTTLESSVSVATDMAEFCFSSANDGATWFCFLVATFIFNARQVIQVGRTSNTNANMLPTKRVIMGIVSTPCPSTILDQISEAINRAAVISINLPRIMWDGVAWQNRTMMHGPNHMMGLHAAPFLILASCSKTSRWNISFSISERLDSFSFDMDLIVCLHLSCESSSVSLRFNVSLMCFTAWLFSNTSCSKRAMFVLSVWHFGFWCQSLWPWLHATQKADNRAINNDVTPACVLCVLNDGQLFNKW